MIREATKDDIDFIVGMGSVFHSRSPWKNIEFDAEATRSFVSALLENGVVFVSESGMIGGMLNPLYFNPAFVVACEMFWWAEKDGRQLMDRFEEWARDKGASGIQFSALGNEMAERMDRLFDKAGYRKVETGYFKEV